LPQSIRPIAGLALMLVVCGGVPVLAQGTAPAAVPPPAPPKLSGPEAWKALVGNTATGSAAGEAFSEYFDPAGGVKYVDKNGVSEGTWALQGNRVCFDFPDEDDHSCSTFEVTGSSGSAIDDDGATIHFQIQPGNSKRL
jgi:hypothetical protein